MIDLEQLRTFYYSIKEGSVAKAAELLGRNKSTLFKHLSDLEKITGGKLFVKNKKQLILTDKGRDLFCVLNQNLPNIENISKDIVTDVVESDQLRILTTAGIIGVWIVRTLKKLREEYPNLKISILTTNNDFDLENSKADVAILPRQSSDNLTHRKVRTLHTKLFASPDYLAKHGTPQTLEDLENHELIGYYSDFEGNLGNVDWHLTRNVKNNKIRRCNLTINSGFLQYEAVMQGLGIITSCEEFEYFENSNIVQLLPHELGLVVDIFYITRRKMILTDMHKRFLDLLQEDEKSRQKI